MSTKMRFQFTVIVLLFLGLNCFLSQVNGFDAEGSENSTVIDSVNATLADAVNTPVSVQNVGDNSESTTASDTSATSSSSEVSSATAEQENTTGSSSTVDKSSSTESASTSSDQNGKPFNADRCPTPMCATGCTVEQPPQQCPTCVCKTPSESTSEQNSTNSK